MDLLAGLNTPQRAAIEHQSGPLLIFAGAGSGKTRTLTHRIAYLIQEHKISPARILAVTFTNKASKEMRARLEALTGPQNSSRLWMGTFHSVCAKMLRIHGEQIDISNRFVIFDSDDSSRVMKDVLKEADLDSTRYPPARMLGRVSDAKNKMLRPEDLDTAASRPNDRIFARLYKNYQARLTASNGLDFDDLLLECVRLLEQSTPALEYWSERFQHILIDEFQDVNAAQFRWAQLLAGKHRNICVVGDDDQCLPAGTGVLTPRGQVPIENLRFGDQVIAAAGRGTTTTAAIEKIVERPFQGLLVEASTKSGHVLRATPNHMCFARLGVREDVHYVYLMYRRDKGYRVGITVGARSDGRREQLISGLQVHVNQENADKVWILRVCPSREEAILHEQIFAFEYGIPTTIFHVRGRAMQLSQAGINDLYSRINTRERAARLMEGMGLNADHPHYRPSGVYGLEMPHRMTIHMTAFGGDAPSLAAPWFRHRVWLNTSDRVLEAQVARGGIETRPGKANTWRVERSYKEMQRSAELADQLSHNVGGADIARWATLSSGTKFAFTPASHLRPTMIVPIERDGEIIEDEIVSIRSVPHEGVVYDLNVADLHNYIADGVAVHNSIYAWRGANVKIILDFEREYPDANIIKLEQNYRSTQNILDAAHGVISQNFDRSPKQLWSEYSGGAQLLLHGAANAGDEASWVVQQIKEIAREEKKDWNDFAILCRVNAQSRAFEDAFMRARLPLKLVGAQRFYERREIKDLIAYLKVLFNPSDAVALSRIINVPARGIGTTTIEKLQGLARDNQCSLWEIIADESLEGLAGKTIAAKIKPLRDLLMELQTEAARDEKIATLLTLLLRRTHYLEHLAGERDGKGEDRIANVEEFLVAGEDFDNRFEARDEEESLARSTPEGAENENQETGNVSSASENFFEDDFVNQQPTRLAAFLEATVLEDSGERTNVPNAETQPDEAVTLMTFHAAKGLEFPVVFLVGAEQGLLPHARALWGETATPDELEEERRLCYVGITRAQEKVIITHAAERTLHGRTEATQPSLFIDEIPSHLLKRSGFARVGSSNYYRERTADWSTPLTTTRDSNPPKKRNSNDPPTYEVGDRLRHPTFGEGIVLNSAGHGGAGEWVEVAFLASKAGKKKLIVAYAPLEKVA